MIQFIFPRLQAWREATAHVCDCACVPSVSSAATQRADVFTGAPELVVHLGSQDSQIQACIMPRRSSPPGDSNKRKDKKRREDKENKQARSASHTARRAGQSQCQSCFKFMCRGDLHSTCVRCSSDNNILCSPQKPCKVCKHWDSAQWAKYLAHAQKARERKLDQASKLAKILQRESKSDQDRSSVSSWDTISSVHSSDPGK